MEGRETGSPGHRKAAEYVAKEFAALGLKPAGTDGYFQPVEFQTTTLDESASTLEFVRGGKVLPIEIGDQAILSKLDSEGEVEAEMVFIGYGLKIPDIDYDDYEGLDLKGKVAVRFSGLPGEAAGPLGAYYSSGEQRRKNLEAAGAIGSGRLYNPDLLEVPWSRIAASRFGTSMDLADPELSGSGDFRVGFAFNPEHADMLLEGSGHSLDELRELAKEGKPLPRFKLPVKVRARTVIEESSVTSDNVLAILPGSDPELTNEYVLLSAHLDHTGVLKNVPEGEDAINNGAMDNASGVAALIESARMIQRVGAPKRSVVLLACTGEEKGLLGAKYYAARPTVPMKDVVANINLDMYLPIFPLDLIRGYGVEESNLADYLESAATSIGAAVQRDPEPERLIFIRSDQYNFIKKGVPALFLGFGSAPDTPQEKLYDAWFQERYHGVKDDLEQPVDKEAAAKFNRMMAELAVVIGNADERPRWNDDSFFRRFAE